MIDSSEGIPFSPGLELGWSDVGQVHRQHQGINRKEGVATSILFEVGHGARYQDRWISPGQILDYVGHGDEHGDQTWDSYNRALRNAMELRSRIHVFERIKERPTSRFIYHGYWWVLEANETLTPTGRKLIRFLVAEQEQWTGRAALPSDVPLDTLEPPTREYATTLRVVRDSPMALKQKKSRNFTCELCGTRQLRGDGKPYAEAHHMQPLGRAGPDIAENLIVLCARHHVDFDYGSVAVDPVDRRTIRHKHDVELDGQLLGKSLPASALPFLAFHWERVYKRKSNP